MRFSKESIKRFRMLDTVIGISGMCRVRNNGPGIERNNAAVNQVSIYSPGIRDKISCPVISMETDPLWNGRAKFGRRQED